MARTSVAVAYEQASGRQREAARVATGLTDSHIKRLKQGTAAPWVIRAIAAAIGVSPDDLEPGAPIGQRWSPEEQPA